MKKCPQIYSLFLVFLFSASCKEQRKTELPKDDAKSETKDIIFQGPTRVTRTIKQDRKGNIWMASWDGVFRYDGKSFTNITSGVSKARFFSILEDREGNFWFASIGSGVYYYDGISFQNFTTREGLLNNDVGSIYEDKKGNIWFGVFGEASRYDGNSFRNYIINGDAMNEDRTGKTFPDRPPYEVTSIIEDKTGKFWFGTRNKTFVYDARLPDGQGKTFTVVTHNGKPFTNVRTIIEDKKGNIWLCGNDGLWRYDGSTFTNVTPKPASYVYEDKNGNIWTSSAENVNGQTQVLILSRYEAKSLSNVNPTVTEIKPKVEGLFGILEAYDGSIWFGTDSGVYRYDGNTITDVKGKEGKR